MESVRKDGLLCRTWKTKTAAAVLAVIAAVALPQLFHLVGMVSGLGSAPGETFLPMHISIFLVGFFAGPLAGLAAGALSLAISFLLTTAAGASMPALPMLPYMTVELAVYGLVTGLFSDARKTKLPPFVALLLAQVAGRAARALALVVGVLGFGFGPGISVIWTSIAAGLPGLILQWTLIPLLVALVGRRERHD